MTQKTGKTCRAGKSCGGTCIANSKKCRVTLPPEVQTPLQRLRKSVVERAPHVAEHVGKGVVAWKAGKVLGAAVAGHLESQYGIPREASQKLAETIIQGVTMTALEAPHLKTVGDAVKKLIVETAAAYLGKTAHGEVETVMDAKEVSDILRVAAPTLAGKVTGIATATLGGKASVEKIRQALVDRATKDTELIRNLFAPRSVNFAETDATAEFLADLAVLALMVAQNKGKTLTS